MLISYDCEMNDERILSALTECQSSLANTEHEHFDLGCSAPVCNLSKMSNCYAQAKKAVQFGRSLDINGHVYLYSNYYDLGLISYGRDSVESNIFYTRIINPILDHDKYSGTDLMRTLESSFANRKNGANCQSAPPPHQYTSLSPSEDRAADGLQLFQYTGPSHTIYCLSFI